MPHENTPPQPGEGRTPKGKDFSLLLAKWEALRFEAFRLGVDIRVVGPLAQGTGMVLVIVDPAAEAEGFRLLEPNRTLRHLSPKQWKVEEEP